MADIFQVKIECFDLKNVCFIDEHLNNVIYKVNAPKMCQLF